MHNGKKRNQNKVELNRFMEEKAIVGTKYKPASSYLFFTILSFSVTYLEPQPDANVILLFSLKTVTFYEKEFKKIYYLIVAILVLHQI